jgi:TrmH family RNA methyltransferase
MAAVNDPISLARIVFVLDRPKDAANVGAVVRLMGNFGLSTLRVVEPAGFQEDQLTRYARRGEALVRAIRRFHSIDDALADCVFVLGTTRRSRALSRPVFTPRVAARVIVDALGSTASSAIATGAPAGLAAVVFGPEDFGLSNASLERCNAILTIPTVPDDASLNLAQAALLVAYEIHLAASTELEAGNGSAGVGVAANNGGETLLASGAELQLLFDAATRMYAALHPNNIEGQTRAAVARLRALILRAVPRTDEIAQLRSIFEHVARAPRGQSDTGEMSPNR